MSTPRKKRPTQPKPKKTCSDPDCQRLLDHSYFFKVDSPMFPDGRINICRYCVRRIVDLDDMEQVITFLRQIDKPFIQRYWDEAVTHKNHTLGEYIRKVNSLKQVKDKEFDHTEGVNALGKTQDIIVEKLPDVVKTEKGKLIEYNNSLKIRWGLSYKKHEYLAMEKFYQDMDDTHEIHTPIHKSMLMRLSKLSIKMDRYLEADNMGDFEKASRQFETSMKSAGFRPVDRQGTDDATGIRSFSQIFEEVEKRGFRKPPAPVFDEDVVDQIIVALANYYHRLVGKPILRELPEEIINDMDAEDFYEDDLTPVEIDDDEYEDLDFSVDDDEDDE